GFGVTGQYKRVWKAWDLKVGVARYASGNSTEYYKNHELRQTSSAVIVSPGLSRGYKLFSRKQGLLRGLEWHQSGGLQLLYMQRERLQVNEDESSLTGGGQVEGRLVSRLFSYY